MTITDAMVEAALEAFLVIYDDPDRDREAMRAALEAAYPHIGELERENQKLWTKVRALQDSERETRLTEKLAW